MHQKEMRRCAPAIHRQCFLSPTPALVEECSPAPPPPSQGSWLGAHFSSSPWLLQSDSKRCGMSSPPWLGESPETSPADLVWKELRVLRYCQCSALRNLTSSSTPGASCGRSHVQDPGKARWRGLESLELGRTGCCIRFTQIDHPVSTVPGIGEFW